MPLLRKLNTLDFNKRKSGIAPVAIIVVVVIIIAAVGVAAYVALAKPSSTNSTVTTSTLQTATSSGNSLTGATGTTSVPPPVTTTSSSASSSSSTTTSPPSSTSTASSQSTTSSTTQAVSTTGANLGYFANVKDLIGNFSQMSILISAGNSSGTIENESLAYYVVGTPTINGSQLTEVNFTFTGSSSESSQSGSNVSLVIFYNSQGNITLLEENGQNLTGTYAQFGAFIVLPFNLFLSYQQGILKNFSAYANFQNQGTTTETYGHLTLPVTTYTANNFSYQNFTATSATFKLGHLPNSNLEILTLISVSGATEAGKTGLQNFEYALVSATPG
jgi:hypothetical protein